MKNNTLKYFILLLLLLATLLIYLSTVGLETDKFNDQIKKRISQINKNIDIDLKKIKLILDPFKLKIYAKTVGTTIYFAKRPLALESIKAQVSLSSLIKNEISSSNIEVTTMAYSEKVIDHYENPRNVGGFDKDDKNIATGMVGAPACGDVMKLQLKVGENGVIEDAKFKTYGCGSAIASSSLVTEWVKGKTLDEATTIKNTDIAEELALPPVKIHCSILAEDAIKAAVADYKAKNA